VSESHWDKILLLTENEPNFIFRVKTHAENDGWLAVWFSALNNISPEPGYAVRQSFVLLLLSDHSGQYNRRKMRPSGKDKSFQVMLATLCPGLVNPACFIGKSHALKACFYLNNLTIVS